MMCVMNRDEVHKLLPGGQAGLAGKIRIEYVTFQMAEVAVPRELFAAILERANRLDSRALEALFVCIQSARAV